MAKHPRYHRPSVKRSRRGPLRLGAALLILAGTLTYSNSLSGPFLFDDERSIVENQQIRRLWPVWDALRPPRETPVAGRPLVNLSFAVNYAAGGLAVRGYHLFNVTVHLLCALVLFGIVRRTLGSPKVSEKFSGRATTLAWICALVWTLHPLQTEAVNYVTERTESIMALFFLLTMYCSIRAEATERPRPLPGAKPVPAAHVGAGPHVNQVTSTEKGSPLGAGRWEAAAIVSCLLGTACKESIVTAPVVVLLYDRVFLFESFRQSWGTRWRLYVGLAATWLSLAALMLRGPRASSVGFSNGVSMWTYLLNQARVVTHYLRLAIWPRGLVLDYGLPQPLTIGQVLPSILLVLSLLALTVIWLARQPFWGFLGAWFFLTLAPTSSFVPISTEVGAERRMYLPVAAIVVLAVMAGHFLLDRLTAQMEGTRVKRTVGFGLTTAVCALLAFNTIDRNREYQSRLTMARTIVERRPHGRAHFLLGTELLAEGLDHDEAMAHFWESARDYPGARYALGTELVATGKLDEGVQQLQMFIGLLPSHLNVIPARQMIGQVLLAQGKFGAAEEQFNLILQAAPSFADAHGYLGDAFLAEEHLPQAILHYQEFLKARPASARAHANLGLALVKSGRLDEAIAEFRRSLEIDDHYDQAREYLAYALKLKSP